MDTQSIIGKRISYYDGFSNTHSEIIIAQISFDEDRDGFRIYDTDPQKGFFFIKREDMEILIRQSTLTRWGNIDNCPFREVITIQGLDPREGDPPAREPGKP